MAGRYPFNHLAAIRHLSDRDPRMGALIAEAGRFRMTLEPHQHPFESLLSSILYQQLHGSAAAAILQRVKDQIGGGGFPSPGQLLHASDETLRATGLSRQKSAALRDLAAKTHAGVVPDWVELTRLDDAAIIERLTTVRGVGVWTVQMLLMFRLGRPDVLPVLDYGVRYGFQLAYRRRAMPTPKELATFGERWKPYRTVASWYLWRQVHLHREKASQARKAGSRRVKS